MTTTALPHPGLRSLVTAYHGYRYDAFPAAIHHGLPAAELTVVLSFDSALEMSTPRDPGAVSRHWMLAAGLRVEPALIHQRGPQHGIQLGLTPAGARELLGLPAGALVGSLVALDDLLGPAASRMYDEVTGAHTWPARFAALDRHLLALVRAAQGPAMRRELAWAWTSLQESHGSAAVGALAGELGWSRQHLSGQFRAEFGLSPKQVARVVRFQHSRPRVLARTASLADVAVESGYADQAHLTREWQDLAGYTPTQWLRAELPSS